MLQIIQSRSRMVFVVGAVLAVFLAALTVGEIISIRQEFRQGVFTRTFNVSGEGKVFAIPDIAEFDATVLTEGKEVSITQKDNAERINRVVAFLKNKGIQESDIRTTNYYLAPRYEYNEETKRSFISGYTQRQTLTVKVRELSKVGELLEGVTSAGANEVSSLRFTFSDVEKFRRDARELAFKQAKKKAEESARAAGFGLGKLITFSEGGTLPSPIYERFSLGAATPQAAPVVPEIPQGAQEITVTISATYEIR